MTEVEKPKAAVDPALLPEDERETFLKANPEFITGPIEQPEFSPRMIEDDDGEQLTPGQKFFQNKATEAMRYWSQFTTYPPLKLEGGGVLKLYWHPASKRAKEAIKSYAADIASGRDSVTGKKLSVAALRQKENEFEEFKVKTYLRKVGTDEPPSMDEIMSVADSTEIDGILEACQAKTLSLWHEGKK